MSLRLVRGLSCFLALLSKALADLDKPDCLATTLTTVTETYRSTSYVYKDIVNTIFISTIYDYIQGVSTLPVTTVSQQVNAGPIVYDDTLTYTSTIVKVKTVTKTCSGGTYVLACPKIKGTSTDTYTTTLETTPILFITFTESRDSYVHSTRVKQTITTGNPKTTKVVYSTKTAVTITGSYNTSTTYKSTKTVLYTFTGTYSAHYDTTKVVTVTAPTTALSITLFSLQVTDTKNELDGLTIGKSGKYAVFQNSTIQEFYIDPISGVLVHAQSNTVLSAPTCDVGDTQDCNPELKFVENRPLPPRYALNDQPILCKIKCGSLLKCKTAFTGIDICFTSATVESEALGWNLVYNNYGPEYSLNAVSPRKGRCH